MAKIMLRNVRLAFPKLWTPAAFEEGQTPQYQATLLIPEDSSQVQAVRQAMKVAATEKWGDKLKDEGFRKKVLFRALRPGSEKSEYDGFAGCMFMQANNKKRPSVFDRNRSPLVESDGRPYAGCYINASVELWAQDNRYGKAINASLLGVQFVSDGESFGGGSPAAKADDFDDLGDEDGEATTATATDGGGWDDDDPLA